MQEFVHPQNSPSGVDESKVPKSHVPWSRLGRQAHLPSLRDASNCFAVEAVWSRTEASARRLAADVPPAKALWGEAGPEFNATKRAMWSFGPFVFQV